MKTSFEHAGWQLLDCAKYERIRHILDIEFNVFFARQVLEGKITGLVHVDNVDVPKACLVHHPHGMLLLAGEPSPDFNAALKDFMLNNGNERTLWLQATDNWHEVIDNLLGHDLKYFDGCQSIGFQLRSGVVRFRRLNFRFNRVQYLAKQKITIPDGFEVVEIDSRIFSDFDGIVVPKYFWDTADDFLNDRKGFALLDSDNVASASFSAFMVDNYLEIGIETAMEYRGRGLAEIVCRALIDYALENGLEPVWSCRKDNAGSWKLAEKLGFEVSLDIPYYGLRKL